MKVTKSTNTKTVLCDYAFYTAADRFCLLLSFVFFVDQVFLSCNRPGRPDLWPFKKYILGDSMSVVIYFTHTPYA